NGGWTVLHDVRVINGLMIDPTASKPTTVYENAEDPTFPSAWSEHGGQLETAQEAYTQEEIDGVMAASWDLGGDDTPDLMRIYQDPYWKPLGDDRHDYGIKDSLELDFESTGIGLQDWTDYPALTFWMSLDNFKRVDGSRETIRMFYFKVRLQDDGQRNAYFGPLTEGYYLSNNHQGYDSADSPANGAWRQVRIPLAEIDPLRSFDITLVDEVYFYLSDFELRWYNQNEDAEQSIVYNVSSGSEYGVDGEFVFNDGTTEHKVRFWPESPTKHRLYYTDALGDPHGTAWDPVHDHTIQWVPDPGFPAAMEDLYFEDHLNPNLRIDQIQVTGRPASNAYLEYGLPRSFRYAVTHLAEYKTF
ncbi:MAG: hypothetical protein GTO12_13540, partial [Proteobacteria bacterium]|nr:hypothetical protein [Pseudomonadota bacterium]